MCGGERRWPTTCAVTSSTRNRGRRVVNPTNRASDAAAVARDFGLSDLRRDQPSVERVSLKTPGAAHAHRPTCQVEDLDVGLLAGNERNIRVLVDVSGPALCLDMIQPRRNVAIERTAVFDGADIDAVRLDVSQIEALGGQPGAIKPDPGLARGDGSLDPRLLPRAARRDQQQCAR